MSPSLVERLRCISCGSGFSSGPAGAAALSCASCGASVPIRGGIPRFVSSGGYAETFGRQWRTFQREQMDSFSGTTLSRDRFYDVTRWSSADLAGKWVLDVGCGAGRFAEIALAAGAHVVAVDLSSAVEACTWCRPASSSCPSRRGVSISCIALA
jgi:hypothetical protein